MKSATHCQFKSRWPFLIRGLLILISIRCQAVEAGSSRRRTRSRSHRGMIGSLGALNHNDGNASQGWEKIQQHLDGLTEPPTEDPDRYGTEAPVGDDGSIIDVDTTAPVVSPTMSPTKAPVAASNAPTKGFTAPTKNPTQAPDPTSLPTYSKSPTGAPTKAPSPTPSLSPSKIPTVAPSKEPSGSPIQTPSKAPSEEPSNSPSGSAAPTNPPLSISVTAVVCPDADVFIVTKVEVWWKYSVQFEASTDTTAAMRILEQKIASEIEDGLLYCLPAGDAHRLDYGIIGGVDYFPLDEPQREVCPGDPVNCLVYRGIVELYLVAEDGSEDAILEARKSILNIMNDETGALNGDGIINVEYLAPDLGTTALQEDRSNGNLSADGGSVSAPTVVMLSLGVICVIVALSARYRYKNRGDDVAAASTIGPGGSQLTMTSSKISTGTNSTPGFSVMMPPSYRLGESHCLDAVLEGDCSDTSSQARSSEIIVSECGYSSEGSSRDMSSLQYSREHILGAYTLAEGESRDDFDDYLYEESNSDIPSPYDDSDHDDSSFQEFRSQGPSRDEGGSHLKGGSALSYATDFSMS